MPYMVLSDADAFIEFIKAVFNAEEKLRVPAEDRSVMHAEYSINGGTIMFGQAGGVEINAVRHVHRDGQGR